LEAIMATLVQNRPTVDAVAVPAPVLATADEVPQEYTPASRGAPRSARRIAMEARRGYDRRLGIAC
jgi:hypothetical protein